MSGDVHVRICERLEGRFLWATRLVIGFQQEDDAKRVMEVLPKRFAKYGLEIHPEKSRLLSFGKPAKRPDITRGDNTFDFLGFTHYWARTRQGYWVIKRKTARKKVRKTVQALWTQEDGAGPLDLVSEQSTHGPGEATQNTVLEATWALSVLWRALQHASDGSHFTPCQAWLEILAKSP